METFSALEAQLAGGGVDLVEFERVPGAFLAGCGSTWMIGIIGMLDAHSVRLCEACLDHEVAAEADRLSARCWRGAGREPTRTRRSSRALTAPTATKEDNAALPVTPEEIAASTADCVRAGRRCGARPPA